MHVAISRTNSCKEIMRRQSRQKLLLHWVIGMPRSTERKCARHVQLRECSPDNASVNLPLQFANCLVGAQKNCEKNYKLKPLNLFKCHVWETCWYLKTPWKWYCLSYSILILQLSLKIQKNTKETKLPQKTRETIRS